MPILRDIFPLIYLTCDLNVKCWSTTTPKNFVWLVLMMTTSLITKLLLRAIWPLRLRKIMKCVFLRFNDSLLVFSQPTTLIIFSFMIFTRSSGFLPDTNIFDSSAKKSENRTLDILARSFMYNKGGGMACGGLPFPGTGCPIPDVDYLCLLCIDFYVWDSVSIFNHLPRMFLFTDFAFRITDWTCCHGPHLHAILRIITRGVSGLATDSPCCVWGRGWTTCLLHDGPLFGSHFKMRVGV